MMLSVMSAVAVIYAIVIIYVPSKRVLESNLEGPKMCTTLNMQENIVGVEECNGWTACVEWCLSKSNKECSHVTAIARERGTEIFWNGCDFTEEYFVDHNCNIMTDIEEWNCKQFSSEADASLGEVGHKEICSA